MRWVFAILLLSSHAFAADFPLASGGASAVKIVMSSNPDASVTNAAIELQLHIALATGVTLAITNENASLGTDPLILVGDSPITQGLGYDTNTLAYQQFKIDVTSSNIVIFGRDTGYGLHHEMGTSLAAYTFLRDYLGCRWYFPGSLGQVVPANAIVAIAPANRTVQPDMYLLRTTRSTVGSGLPISSTDHKVWMWRNRLGGPDIAIGHSFADVITESYVATNPEYFAWNADLVTKRFYDVPHPNNVSLCLSNTALVTVFADAARAYFNASPNNKSFRVIPPDSFSTYRCRCAWCEARYDYSTPGVDDKMTESRYVWDFASKVAAELVDEYPDRYVLCIAYAHYRWPWPDLTYYDNQIVAPTFNRVGFGYQPGDSLVDILPWTNTIPTILLNENYYAGVVGGGSVQIWDGAPRLCPHRIASEIQSRYPWVKGEPTDVYLSSGNIWRMWLADSLNLYITAEFEFDQTQDADALIDGYCNDLFGPGAPYMKKFLTLCEERWTQMPRALGISFYQQPTQEWTDTQVSLDKCWKRVYPRWFISELRTLVNQAKAATSSTYLQRVQLFETSFLDYMDSKSITHLGADLPARAASTTLRVGTIRGK